jgi:hypothetical protein
MAGRREGTSMSDHDPKPPGGNPSDAPRPIGEIKPPREWRTTRSVEERRVAPPRVTKTAPEPTSPERPWPAYPPFLRPDLPEPRWPGIDAPGGSHAPYVAPTVPPPAPLGAAAPSPELPARYGIDRLVALVRDPYWVYAWWELTASCIASGRREIGDDAVLVLRVYDITAILWDGMNHHSHFDVRIDEEAGSWYLELGKPGASFVAEIGLRAPDGRFLALVRSNVVSLPRDGVSDVIDDEWMLLEADERLLYERAAGGLGGASGEFSRLLEQRLRAEMASGLSSRGAASGGLAARTGV